jgi:hypothetical protein
MKKYVNRPVGYVGIENSAHFKISPHAIIENPDDCIPVNENYQKDHAIGKATNFRIVGNALVVDISMDDDNFSLSSRIFRAAIDIPRDEFHNATSLSLASIGLVPKDRDSFQGIIE